MAAAAILDASLYQILSKLWLKFFHKQIQQQTLK